MTRRKQRLTVTVDPELIEAGNRAVASGGADSLSAWVSLALSDKARRDLQLEQLRVAVADYEAEFGEITAEDIATQRHADREDAVVVRGRKTPPAEPAPHEAIDKALGRAAGELLGATGLSDVVDASLALLATDGDEFVTFDRDDFEILLAATGRHVELIRP